MTLYRNVLQLLNQIDNQNDSLLVKNVTAFVEGTLNGKNHFQQY